jgi:xanthine phosphoribosyltransferase
MSLLSKKISWEQFEVDIKFLAEKLRGKGFTKILAVTKGGLIPAYYLAKILGINYIDTVCIESYKGREKQTIKIIKMPYGAYEEILVVDDLIDSGSTIKEVKKHFKNAKAAVLYEKKSSPKGLAEYSARKYLSDKWLLFPWGD